jgi:predicted transcriptional regulator
MVEAIPRAVPHGKLLYTLHHITYSRWYYMAVVTVRVPDDVKAKMKEVKVNWSEEIRRFITQRIEDEERKRNLQKAIEILKGRKKVEKGFSAKSVREDRDSN